LWFYENWHKESCIFLVGINEITFMCILCNHTTFLKYRMPW
jgi:hypothetical protein